MKHGISLSEQPWYRNYGVDDDICSSAICSNMCQALSDGAAVTSEKGLSIGCQFSILLGTYTHVTLLSSWLNLSLDCHGSSSRLLTQFLIDHPQNRITEICPHPGSNWGPDTAVALQRPAAVHSAKASMPMLHREKGYRLDVNSLYYWVHIPT
jgi:hypothetical protein